MGCLRSTRKSDRPLKRSGREIEKAHRVAKDSYNEEKRLARDAAKAISASLSPLEHLKQEREKLRKQLQLGIITEKDFQKVNAKLIADFKAAKQNTQEFREEQRKLNAEVRRGEEVTRSAETAQEKYSRKVNELRALLDRGRISQETFNRKVRAAKDELRESEQSAGLLENRYVTLGFALAGLGAAYQAATEDQARFREESEETSRRLDKLTRQFQVQAGLNALQATESRQNILQVARDNAVNEETAFFAATELVSQGFVAPESSGVLDSLLKIKASSNIKDGELPPVIAGLATFLEASGLEKNQQNLLDLGIRSRGLFKENPLQVRELGAFSKAAPTFSNADIDLETTLSTFNILRKRINSAEEVAVQARNVVTSLQTFSADKGKRSVLKDVLKLDPNEVDLVGESFPEALGVLGTAISALPKEQQAPALTKLFGRENLQGALGLLNNLDEFETSALNQRDRAGFVQGVNVSQSGVNAARTRLAIDNTLFDLEKEEEATQRALSNQQLRLEDKENFDASGPIGDFALGVGTFIRDKALKLGADPNRRLSPEGQRAIIDAQRSDFTLGELQEALMSNSAVTSASGDVSRDLSAAIRQNTEAMRENSRLLQQPNNRSPSGPQPSSAPSRPPSAGLGR